MARAQIDGLICISGTFHLGHLVLELVKTINKPCMLWAFSELPYDGGKIRLNSVCGLNLNASNLYKAGIRNFHWNISDQVDTDWLDALRIIAALGRARIGLAGHHAHGFFNLSHYAPSTYQNLGVLVDHVELDQIWNQAVEEDAIVSKRQELQQTFDISGVSAEQVDRVATLAACLEAFYKQEKLQALAIRCWPEFAANFGISPCAAMSLLQAQGLILTCEGDVEGALSMLAQQAVGGETPFLFDLSQVNFQEDYALLWHCGVAPCNLWDGCSNRSLDTYFAGGKGVTADFVLKEGPISILRFDSAGPALRIYLQQATGLKMDKDLKGTYLKARFTRPVRQVIDELIQHGVAHHASMVYGDFIKPFQLLSRIKGFSVIGQL